MYLFARFALYAVLGCIQALVAADALQESLPTVTSNQGKQKEIRCRVFNWERMVCSWDSQDNTTYSMDYKLGVFGKYTTCPLIVDGRECRWSSPEDYISRVRLLVPATKTSTSSLEISPPDIVQPDPVKGLTVSDNTSHSAQLRWAAPQKPLLISTGTTILYQVSVSESHTKILVKIVDTGDNNLKLTDLHAYTKYTVNVSCIPQRKKSPTGFWSNITSITLDTSEDVPSVTPVVTPGAFYDTSDVNSRTVVIYWQNPANLNSNGIITSTRVKYRFWNESEEWMTEYCQSPFNCALSQLVATKIYEVKVDSGTSKGFNESLAENLMSVLVSDTAQEANYADSLIVLSNRSHVQVHWPRMHGALGYTVYWCKGSNKKCSGELSWLTIPANREMTDIPQLNQPTYLHTQFGWSVERLVSDHVQSSGITWSKCTNDINREIVNPKDFGISAQREAGSLSVTWSSLGCGHAGYITNYIIKYWPYQPDSSNRSGVKEQLLNVTANKANYDEVISNLTVGFDYLVQLKSWSRFGESKYSVPIQATVQGSGVADSSEFKVSVILLTVVPLVLFTAVVAVLCFACRCPLANHLKRIKIEVPVIMQQNSVSNYPDSNGSSFHSNQSIDGENFALLDSGRPSPVIRPPSAWTPSSADNTSQRDNLAGPSGSSTVSEVPSYTKCAMTAMTTRPGGGGQVFTVAGIHDEPSESDSLVSSRV